MRRPPRVLMLFLDGVGIGRADREVNPFFAATLPAFRGLLDGELPHKSRRTIHSTRASVIPLDATLGIPGLPQSGTGQTTLFTGINAAKLIGKHYGPYPYSSLRTVIKEHNIFRALAGRGRTVFYANAYPQRYFEHLSSHRTRITATVMAWLESGFPLNGHAQLSEGSAIAADITNEHWVRLGFGHVPVISTKRAGERLLSILGKYDFVLYDFFHTDHAGHSRSMENAVGVLQTLDAFLGGILEAFDPDKNLLIITSDHGNIEDLSKKTHTRNPVPLIALGSQRAFITTRSKNLTHVTPAIIDLLS